MPAFPTYRLKSTSKSFFCFHNVIISDTQLCPISGCERTDQLIHIILSDKKKKKTIHIISLNLAAIDNYEMVLVLHWFLSFKRRNREGTDRFRKKNAPTSFTKKAWKPYGTLPGSSTTATGSGDIVFASITLTADFL